LTIKRSKNFVNIIDDIVNSSDEFYTPAQHIIALAIKEAKQLNQGYLGTEHILLALTVDKDSTVARALSDIGLTPGKLRDDIIGNQPLVEQNRELDFDSRGLPLMLGVPLQFDQTITRIGFLLPARCTS